MDRRKFRRVYPTAMDHDYYVYILSNNSRSTIYIGITSDLEGRLWEHRNPDRPSFTQRYHCVHLVFYEHFRAVRDALAREKQLKNWTRAKKNAVIAAMNPRWEDLSADWT